MKQRIGRRPFQQRILVRPQYRQLYFDDGTPAMDYVGRYEDLQTAYDEVCEHIGIPATRLEQKNASQHRAYQDYYDKELREQIGDFYAGDLERFSYTYATS